LIAWNGDIEAMELALTKGAEIEAKNIHGGTPLHDAIQSYKKFDKVKAVQFLLSKGAKIDVKTKTGKTPLSLAEEKGHSKIVELLTKHGAKE